MAYSITDYNPDDWKQVQATMLLEKFDDNEIIATPTAYKKKYKNLYDNNYTAILPGLNSMAGEIVKANNASVTAVKLANEARDELHDLSNDLNAEIAKLKEENEILNKNLSVVTTFLRNKYNITFDEFYSQETKEVNT